MEDQTPKFSKLKRSKKPSSSSKKSSPEPGILSDSVQPEKPKFSNQDDQCIWHHKQLTLYCETREEPLCEECVASQYKTLSSKIIPIDEAYRYRIASIYNTLSTHLFGRKEQLEAQSRRIEFRLDELKRFKNKIERDMQAEFGGMLERLGSAFNSHGGLIQSDKQSLESDLENINEIISELASADRDLVKFLMNYRKIKYSLETAISKPFRSDIKVTPTDLPRELEEIRGLSAKCVNLQALVEFKNDMIWNFLHDRVPTCKVTKEIEKELKDWAALTDKFSAELEKYALICEFCGVVINNENVNLPCQKNSSYSILIDSKTCPSSFKGNSRHFFKKIVKPPPSNMIQVTKYADVEDKVLQKISQKARNLNIDVELCFKQFDVLNNEFIAPTDFYFLMIQTFELSGDEVTELIFRFDKLKDGRIRYLDIIKEITAKLPLPFQKIRENSANFLDFCKKKDRLIEGAIGLEGFKDVLRQIGLNGEEIETAVKDASQNNKGKILYLEFYDKIA